jgi:hypothetical protein
LKFERFDCSASNDVIFLFIDLRRHAHYAGPHFGRFFKEQANCAGGLLTDVAEESSCCMLALEMTLDLTVEDLLVIDNLDRRLSAGCELDWPG